MTWQTNPQQAAVPKPVLRVLEALHSMSVIICRTAISTKQLQERESHGEY